MSAGGQDDTIADVPVDRPAEVGRDGELIAGRYRIVRWLGAGAMGRVYEALDTELGERVAAGLIDVTWLCGCPLFAPVTRDLQWLAVHDAVERRAATMLAAFRAAAG